MFDLKGKVALVTGSSMGLGKAFSLSLAQADAKIVVMDPIGGKEAESVLDELEKSGKESLFVKCDVSDAGQVSDMVNTIIDRFGKIDILVNNAGISVDATTVNYQVSDWDRVIKINLSGAFYCSKYCLSSMKKQKFGRIINISSLVGQMGAIGTPAYAASKSGMFGFTKTLAREVARDGITVNCISLGYMTGGGMMKTLPQKIEKGILSKIPMGRWGKPEDITGAINYLVSDSASYITGQTININGGYFM